MRVLHLIDALAPWGGPCTQRLAADVIALLRAGDPAAQHEVVIIGGLADARAAQRCGLRPVGAIHPRGRRALNARDALERTLAAMHAARAGPDVLHAWSASAGALTGLLGTRIPSVVTPRPLAIGADSPHLLSREDVRARWVREEDLAHDEFVLGLLGEPVQRFDARRAMHVAARTGLSSRHTRLIMSGRALGRQESQRFLARLGLDQVIVQDEAVQRPWEVLRGLDAVLLLGPAPACSAVGLSALPLLWAFAADVPVIAEASAPTAGLLMHDETGLAFPHGDLNAACERLARLHDDRTLAHRLASEARRRAAERHDLQVLVRQLHDAYGRAIDRGRDEYVEVATEP